MNVEYAGSEDANAWHAYWRGQATEQVLPPNHPGAQALDGFWTTLIDSRVVRGDARSVADLASGAGEVAERVYRSASAAGVSVDLVCVDIAGSALQRLAARLPGTRTVVADVGEPPLPARSVDLVVSQFGIEYAGPGAFAAAGTLVRPGGRLAAVVHHAGSGIHRECADNEITAAAIIESDLLRSMHGYFERLGTPGATRPQRESAERRVKRAAVSLEQVVRARGRIGAGGVLATRLYQDCAQLYARAANYEPAEVLAWLDGMSTEVHVYRARMKSMQSAALDEGTLATVAARLCGDGFAVARAEALVASSGEPVAWVIEADRPAD